MRWSHGHSALLGGVGALVFTQAHLAFTLALVFGMGLLLGRFWYRASRAAALVIARARELHDAQVDVKRAQADELAGRAEHRHRVKAEQDREVERAYIEGVADGQHS